MNVLQKLLMPLVLFKMVQTYLETLDVRQREIITLRIWEDKSYKEIAEIIGGSEASIKWPFHGEFVNYEKNVVRSHHYSL